LICFLKDEFEEEGEEERSSGLEEGDVDMWTSIWSILIR
jgi:hypothetical protein